jgi:hypothetical protein
MSDLTSKLASIQQTLKAPKGQVNTFGKYKYRSCEDILEAVKPLLGDLVLTISDDIVEVGGRVYVKATASLSSGSGNVSTTAFARESETKKGMDESQITGAASSYARKYALNGLFCIDDTKDSDATNQHDIKPSVSAVLNGSQQPTAPNEYDELVDKLYNSIQAIKTGIEINDLVMSKEAWDELTDEEKEGIWKAPSKGGVFTTQERSVMKSTEFRTATGD